VTRGHRDDMRVLNGRDHAGARGHDRQQAQVINVVVNLEKDVSRKRWSGPRA
jgi:hypothetical protein